MITPPTAPEDITITPPGEVQADLTGSGANPTTLYYWWNGNKGAISQITLKAGVFNIKSGKIINVNGYQAEAFSGTNPQGTQPSDGDQTVDQQFFHTLLNVPYSEYDKDVVIDNNRDDFTLINLETEGIVEGDLNSRVKEGSITEDKKTTLKRYQSYSTIKGTGNTELLFINKGTVNLSGKNTTYLFTTIHTNGAIRTNYIDNEGTIAAKGENSIIIKHSPDWTTLGSGWIYSNNGIMKAEGKGSVVYGAAYTHLHEGRAAFVNDGTIEVSGESAIGVILPKDSANSKLADGHLIYLKKPISLKGIKSMGFVAQNTNISNEKNLVKFNINAEKAIGILQDVENAGTATTAAMIEIKDNSEESMGIYANKGTLNIVKPDSGTEEVGESYLDLKTGKKNIGIYAKGASIVNFDGVTKITGGEGQKIALATDGSIIILKKAVTVGDTNNFVKDAVPLYATGASSKINVEKPDFLKFYLSGNSTAAYAKEKGIINMNGTGSPSEPTIHIKGENGKGIGLFAKDGGVISAKNHHIKVEDGSVALSSIGKDGTNKSKIDFTEGKIDYKGNGYAVYAKDGGEIDLTNGEIILRGKSTAMELDTTATNPITLTNAKITVMSNDVIVYNLTNITTPMNISDLKTTISGLTSGATVQAGIENGITFNKYKIAAVDGGTLNINVAVDKAGDADTTDGGYFFKRFLGQRLKINVNENVTANLTTAQANDDYDGQVVGIEANSSKKASSNSETQVNIAANKKIEAARTDGTDKGATGVFINYGQLENKGTISVEKDTTANSEAVGVYAVNGSDVKNEGNINVGGKQSVGILALAYRENLSTGVSLGAEFGAGAANQGKINVTNTSNITMSDDDAIGIYAKNNNVSAASNDYKVANTGTIEVKKSVSKTAIGIYADKSIVLPKDGTIKIGKKAVGIYADNSAIGSSTTDNLGNIDFAGENGVGIYLKGTSTLTGNKVTLKQTTTGDLKGKVGILVDGITNKTFTTEVDTGTGSNAVNDVTAYYSKDNGTLTVQVNISLHQNSTGITGADSESLVYSGSKTMKLGQKSTGIFGQKNITFESGSKIELNGDSSVGVFAKGSSGTIDSKGSITFTKENSIGLYGADGATVKDNTTSMDFSSSTAKNNIGAYLAGAKWIDNRSGAYTFSPDHARNNIYLFAQGGNDGTTDLGSIATLNNEFKVNPSGSATSTAKAIGMYFNTAVKDKTSFVDNTLNMTASNAKISVINSGIGVYAKNTTGSGKNNIINKINVSSSGSGSVGVFTDGNLKLNGTNGLIEAKSNGIGLYGNKGKVTVEGNHKVEITSAGTGAYLTNGSYLSEGKLELKNNTAGTAAAGVYYTKGNATSEVEHKTELHVKEGDNLLALYADGGIKLKNSAKINISKGTSNVGAFVTGSSELNNNANITLSGNGFKQGLGIYVADGKATNSADKTIKVEDKEQNSLSLAMAADKTAIGTSASIVNAGNIDAIGDAIGMYVADYSSGENAGNIKAKNEANLKAIGAYVKGTNATFKNTGKISSDNVALALKDTGASKITKTGSLKLTKTGAVGVYANNSVVDFNITPIVTSGIDKTVALYATGTSK
ncbi:beta strand repeat-containing protein, partial [Fusobacterium necrophorum]|uniref:beta strand repeat-containing protein n=1 Tax=Fusobacterium necrophorum TaxID=859 RepID=UPI0036F2D9F9